MKKFIAQTSHALYRTAEFVDTWLGLPQKMSDSLRFRQEWRNALPARKPAPGCLWIHGASVGELEDLAAFFSDPKLAGFAAERIVLTASSVSARFRLEAWRKLGFAYAGPLPPESPREMRAFLHIFRPEILLLSHSDIWPVALTEARRAVPRGCLWLPSHLPSSRLLVNQFLAGFVSGIGCRSNEDLAAFAAKPLAPAPALRWIGNPRVDRILTRIEKAREKPEHVLQSAGCAPRADRATLLVGSCWIEDARVLNAALAQLTPDEAQALEVVVIPHETHDPHLVATIKGLLPAARVLTVQGVLLEAYRDFSAALVGGGFASGLHNILEPALWELPIFVGPLTRKQPEAKLLEQNGQLFVTADPAQLAQRLRALVDPWQRHELKRQAQVGAKKLRDYEGSTRRLAAFLSSLLDHGRKLP